MKIERIRLISLLCLIAVCNTSLAGLRTEREMLAIAKNKLAKTMTRQAETSEIRKLADGVQYAIYGSDDTGYIVISRDNRRHAILAYSDTQFDTTNIPCGMSWWLKTVERTEVHDNYHPTSRPITYQAVSPLVKTEWGQGEPYNFLTPEINGKHSLTGCVATAMAQLMKFFRYPSQGKGKGYYTKSDNPSRVTLNIDNVYEWDKMMETYDSNVNDEERLPVAILMRDAGLATNMNYGTNDSSASQVDAARGFSKNFSYDSLSIHTYYRNYFTNEEWMTILNDELAKGRPVMYGGLDPLKGGHAFVIDGIDADGLVHVNWGWNGSCNGYYELESLSPIDKDTGSPKGDSFSQEQGMLFGLKCQETPSEDERYTSLWCSNAPYILSLNGKILNIESEAVFNMHFLMFYGVFGLNIESTDGHPENNVFKQIGPHYDVWTFYGVGNLNNSIFLTGIKAGSYHIYLASKADNEETCQPVRTPGGCFCYELIIDADGKASLSLEAIHYTTGITHINNDTRHKECFYDLKGQVYSDGESLGKGIYIVGGKKVLR